MTKKLLSIQENEKFEEERHRPFRMEIKELEHDLVNIKSPILLSRKQFDLIQKMCDITDERL